MTSLETRRQGVNLAGPNTHLPSNWQDKVVVGKSGVPTEQTHRFLTAQQLAEGGDAKWNPLNCTLWIQNFTDLPNYNDVPVRNYSFPDVGVVAIVLTLTQHNADGTLRYGKLVNELQNNSKNGHTAEEIVAAAAADLRRWSGTTDDSYLNLILSVLKGV